MTPPLDQLVEYHPTAPPGPGNGNGSGHADAAVHDRSPRGTTPEGSGSSPAGRGSLRGWFRNRPVTQKVLAAPMLCILALGVVGFTGSSNIGQVLGETEYLYEGVVIPMQELGAIEASMASLELAILEHVLAGTLPDKESRQADAEAALADIRDQVAQFREHDLSGERGDHLDHFEMSVDQAWTNWTEEVQPDSRRGRPETAARHDELIDSAFGEAGAAVESLYRVEAEAAQQGFEDAKAVAASGRTQTLLFLAIAIAGALGLGLAVARLISRPLQDTVDGLSRVASGDLTGTLEVDSTDEVGQMRTSVNEAVSRFRSAVTSMGENSQVLASSAEELSAVSTQMSANAGETSAQAGVVSSAAEEVSANVQTVAAGAEEMSASIREIAQSASQASEVATSGVAMAETTNTAVSKLASSSSEIGEIVGTITSIAEQTNLLALNATIEAARAGEAGKGFAIVANEVKELANQTAKATEEIAAKVEGIQVDSRESVEAISQIVDLMGRINDAQTTIATAVEEQTATANEIGRHISEAASGTTEIARNVGDVAAVASSTAEGADNTKSSATELAHVSAELERLIRQFRY